MKIKLNNETWELGDQIGSGGFGKVFRATNGQGQVGAIKLVPKDSGASRDLLAADLSGVENVIPIIDQGETDADWAMAMPLADKSLRDYLNDQGGKVSVDDAIKLAKDVATSLKGLAGHVVHRDIKPQNIMLLEGNWCLTDFGISRYAEATTASDTQKFALSPPYSAPERWENRRATTATDMYSLGVVLYEAIKGNRPFAGPDTEDYREQHLHSDPSRVQDVPPIVSDLIKESLYKAPETRPSPATFLDRLEHSSVNIEGGGLGALQQANHQQVDNEMAAQREATLHRDEQQSRDALAAVAKQEFNEITGRLKDKIISAAPSAKVNKPNVFGTDGFEWRIELGNAILDLNAFYQHRKNEWGGWDAPAMDVVAYASIDISQPVNSLRYEGRGHSMWYCDAKKQGEYGWYEVAFMVSALIPRSMAGNNGGVRDPFQLNPGEASAKALWNGMAEWQVARPFILLKDTAVDEFIDRWAGYLAAASVGSLNRSSTMPEISPQGSWT